MSFYSEGVKLAGDLFLPADIKPGNRRAGIVLCHGYTGVRSIYLPDNARVLAEAEIEAYEAELRGRWRLVLEQATGFRSVFLCGLHRISAPVAGGDALDAVVDRLNRVRIQAPGCDVGPQLDCGLVGRSHALQFPDQPTLLQSGLLGG